MMHDIHMHIIPGVDDGAWDLDMAKRMLDMAYEQGIQHIIATPHSSAFNFDKDLTSKNYEILKKSVALFHPDKHIYLGCEIYCRKNTMQYILESLKDGTFPTMNGTKYVLVEFSTSIEKEEFLFCVTGLCSRGWIPIIAHMERYRKLFADKTLFDKLKKKIFFDELKNKGCCIQINVHSVFDESDEKIKKNALYLVKEKLVAFLGSDAHRTNHRPPSVEHGLQYLYEHFDRDYIDDISSKNAEKLLGIT